MAHRVAAEIAMNHAKHLDPEHRTSSLEALDAALDKLEFELPATARVAELTVVGGRYCSLDGQLADQVQLRDRQGEPLTLYAAPAVGSLASLGARSVSVDGVDVELWREADVVLGLARTAP